MAEDIDDKKKNRKWLSGPPPMDPNKTYVNPGQDSQMEIEGYIKSPVRSAVTYFCIFITLGFLRLVFHWIPHRYLQCTHRKASLGEATSVLLKDQYQQYFVAEIQTITRDGTRVSVLKPTVTFSLSSKARRRQAQLLLNTGQRDENLIRYFVVKRMKYLWNAQEDRYQKLCGLEVNNLCSYFHEAKGLSYAHQIKRRVLYGVNTIDVHVSPVVSLLFKQALTPFYVFQVFSMFVWYLDEYYYYATCILLISSISITVTIYETRKMQRALRNTIQTSTVVTVWRGGDDYQDIPSEDLVPGDIIEIPNNGCIMQCDAVLISGNCIVNESMLTGESVPVTKTPLPEGEGHKAFDLKEHAKHTLFCGTQVIQTRYYGNQKVKAVVLRTGFLTSKGELVRSILYPKPVDFKFNKDTYFFVGVLASIAGIGLIYTVVLKVQGGEDAYVIVKRSLDLITIAVPPALPAALTVGIVFAQRRLKLANIFCISPRSINICGSINAVCFDKTGTLTEDGLNLQGVVCVEGNEFQDEITNILLLRKGHMMSAMATCHSLTLIEGQLSGDPLDLIMFESINWDLEEPGEENSRFDLLVPTIVYPKGSAEHTMNAEELSKIEHPGDQIGIVRQFTFSSSLQRMSVITRKIGASHFDVYCKGSPEMVASLCIPDTVPPNFSKVLKSYTQHGYRVLGVAWKQLPQKYNYVKVQRISRDVIEKELIFLGLLVMENKLKPETTPIIDELKEANIRVVMVTGDNMLTALSVAHECRMIEKKDKVVLVEASVKAASPPQVHFVYEDSVEKAATLTQKDPSFMLTPCHECRMIEKKDKVVLVEANVKAASAPQVHFVYENSIEKSATVTQKDSCITEIQIEDDPSKLWFAVTGNTWSVLRAHFPDLLSKILVRGVVFARMSPEQKAQLVEALQELGYYVSMCGDGANDCGALKMAHAGISLSEAEASVASPFTSKTPNIMCVPTIIREGRAALVTSFGIFKYMACYSLTQFVSVLILYKVQSNLTDFEFLYIDLFLLTTLSVSYGRTAAYHKLVREPPQLSLTSVAPILSLILQMCIQIAAQVFCYFNVQQQPWFVPHEPIEEDDNVSYENTAIFSMSAYQYIILAVAFSKGAPYRKSIFTNYWFLANLILCFGTTVWCTVYPMQWMIDLLELKPLPSITYRLVFFGIATANCLMSILLETFLLDNAGLREKFHRLRERCCPNLKNEYKIIEEEMMTSQSWPPMNQDGTISSQNSDYYSTEEFSKETDRMLPASDNYNHSSYTTTPSDTPRISMTTAPSLSLLYDSDGTQQTNLTEKSVVFPVSQNSLAVKTVDHPVSQSSASVDFSDETSPGSDFMDSNEFVTNNSKALPLKDHKVL